MSNKIAAQLTRLLFLVLTALLALAWSFNTASAGEAVQISIAGNGQAMIRNAEVTSVAGSVITVTTGWSAAELVWRIETSGSTAFYPQMESREALASIETGHRVSLSGMLDMSAAHPTIRATALRDNSLEDTAARAEGTVLSLDPREKAFTLLSASGTIFISIAPGGTILRDGNPTGLTRLQLGERVTVYGSHNLVTGEFRALKVRAAATRIAAATDPPRLVETEPKPAADGQVTPGLFMHILSWIYAARGSLTSR